MASISAAKKKRNWTSTTTRLHKRAYSDKYAGLQDDTHLTDIMIRAQRITMLSGDAFYDIAGIIQKLILSERNIGGINDAIIPQYRMLG